MSCASTLGHLHLICLLADSFAIFLSLFTNLHEAWVVKQSVQSLCGNAKPLIAAMCAVFMLH